MKSIKQQTKELEKQLLTKQKELEEKNKFIQLQKELDAIVKQINK